MSRVGSGIINVITESLYDNPIVVFREYVQNSVDSIYKSDNTSERDIRIYLQEDKLYFADSGNGIEKELFDAQMSGIADSSKLKQNNLGYKGIGRLSGLPYCDCLNFINILDYDQDEFQQYSLDGKKYAEEKSSEQTQNLSVEEFFQVLSEKKDKFQNIDECFGMVYALKDYFKKHNKGFLVIMENISPVLKNTIYSDKFEMNLSWLLPVDFLPEVCNEKEDIGEIVRFLRLDNQEGAPARFCNIFYNDKKILRPIGIDNFRNTVFQNNFEYAVGMITFNGQKIQIDKKNNFSGIRIYIDNMLLCDESELIPALANYGLLNHSVNGMIQTGRGIGAMIYITDKINISANARRTFIEITDNDSLEFLRYLAEFVNDIYDARYALSEYASVLKDKTKNQKDIEEKKSNALSALCRFVSAKVAVEEIEDKCEIAELSIQEKRTIIKKSITSRISKELKEFIKQYNVENTETYYEDFLTWIETHR